MILGRPLVLENPSSYLEFESSTIAEWEFLSALVERTENPDAPGQVVEVGPEAQKIVTEDWNGVKHPDIGVPMIL